MDAGAELKSNLEAALGTSPGSGRADLWRQLEARILARQATVAVCGMGYAGLPLACAIMNAGFAVIGLDSDPDKVEKLARGESYVRHIPAAVTGAMATSGRFRATADLAAAAGADIVAICVPTPLNQYREPDLSYVVATAQSIAANARRGQLIILESTTFPGTTVDVLGPIFAAHGLLPGTDVLLAFSPEREDPGNAQYSITTIPKVVGGQCDDARDLALAFYGSFVETVIPVSSPGTAEAVKLTENIFRAVNIALVNELKIVYGAMGIDIWEVIEAARTKPFGFMPFYPGPGFGGHCVPIDPFYLAWKSRQLGVETRFIELAGLVNTVMPKYVISRLADELGRRWQTRLKGARILILGIAYKKNIDDMRESPTLKLMELLEAQWASVDYSDPHIPEVPKTRDHPEYAGRRSVPLDAATLGGYDAVLIATDHDNVDYRAVVEHSRLVVDTRNICGRLGLTGQHIIKA